LQRPPLFFVSVHSAVGSGAPDMAWIDLVCTGDGIPTHSPDASCVGGGCIGIGCAWSVVACGGASKSASTPTAEVGTSATTQGSATPIATASPPPSYSGDGNAPGIPTLNSSIQQSPDGLRYIDEQSGDGPAPRPDQTVTVHTAIWLVDGHKIDSTRDRNQPITFALSGRPVFSGLTEGVSRMRVGGRRRLIVPPELGYGSRAIGGATGGTIPADSTLIVDVELLSVQ
jgi:hypothetical protein